MTPLNSVRPFNSTIRTGLVFLILASLAKWFLHPGASISTDMVLTTKAAISTAGMPPRVRPAATRTSISPMLR